MDNKKMNSTGVEDHILDVEHLSMYFTTKSRGKKSTVKAVDDVSFYVKRGETFGLVHPSSISCHVASKSPVNHGSATSRG